MSSQQVMLNLQFFLLAVPAIGTGAFGSQSTPVKFRSVRNRSGQIKHVFPTRSHAQRINQPTKR